MKFAEPMSDDEIARVERIVNAEIIANAATGQYAIRYGSNRTGAWAFETVALPTADPMATVIQGRVVVTRCGAPTVFYIRSHVPSGGSRIVQRLFMATRVGATWSETLVPVPHTPNDPTEDYVDHFDLTAAPDDTLWLTASRAASTWLLNLPPSGSWTSEAVPASYSSISGPVVAVHPTFGPILGYGTSTSSVCSAMGATWPSTPCGRPMSPPTCAFSSFTRACRSTWARSW